VNGAGGQSASLVPDDNGARLFEAEVARRFIHRVCRLLQVVLQVFQELINGRAAFLGHWPKDETNRACIDRAGCGEVIAHWAFWQLIAAATVAEHRW
jgi:hypothetical protein